MTKAEQDAKRRLEWEERIAVFQNSGQSVRKWCLDNDVPEHRMYYWLRKLAPKETQTTKSAKARWVTLQPSTEQLDSGIAVRVGSFVVEVQSNFNREAFAEVVLSLMNL